MPCMIGLVAIFAVTAWRPTDAHTSAMPPKALERPTHPGRERWMKPWQLIEDGNQASAEAFMARGLLIAAQRDRQVPRSQP